MKKYLQSVLLFLKEYKHGVIALILTAIIVDIFFIRSKSDAITLTILGLVIFFFRFYKLSRKKIFILCFIPTGTIFFTFLIDPASIAIEKAAIWLFLLMGTGIIQELFATDSK